MFVDTSKLPTSREAAIEAGKNKYFTGIPCRRGHISARYTSTMGCMGCLRPLMKGKRPIGRNQFWQNIPITLRSTESLLLTPELVRFFTVKIMGATDDWLEEYKATLKPKTLGFDDLELTAAAMVGATVSMYANVHWTPEQLVKAGFARVKNSQGFPETPLKTDESVTY